VKADLQLQKIRLVFCQNHNIFNAYYIASPSCRQEQKGVIMERVNASEQHGNNAKGK
jgi:hypothetical protein